jgi:hypothetical protein
VNADRYEGVSGLYFVPHRAEHLVVKPPGVEAADVDVAEKDESTSSRIAAPKERDSALYSSAGKGHLAGTKQPPKEGAKTELGGDKGRIHLIRSQRMTNTRENVNMSLSY